MFIARRNKWTTLCSHSRPQNFLRNLCDNTTTTTATPQKSKVEIIGAPISFGQSIQGADQAPRLIRRAGLYSQISTLNNWVISERGDILVDPPSPHDPQPSARMGRVNNCFAVGRAAHKICQVVTQSMTNMKSNDLTLVMGGDHSVSIGSIGGLLQVHPKAGIIWVSAHGGLLVPGSASSSNLNRMSLAMLLNKKLVHHAALPGFEWLGEGGKVLEYGAPNLLDPNQITCLALRDLDKVEMNLIREHNIQCFTMYDIDKHGIGDIMKRVIDHHLENDSSTPLHLSYNFDALDPTIVPSIHKQVTGGLTFREAHYVAEALASTGSLKSVDLVELNPTLGTAEESKRSVEIALELTMSALGRTILNPVK